MDCLVVDRIGYERMKLEWQQYRARVQEVERENDLIRNELQLTKKLCHALEQLRECHQSQSKCVDGDHAGAHCCLKPDRRLPVTVADEEVVDVDAAYERQVDVWAAEYAAIKSMLNQLSLLGVGSAATAVDCGADTSLVTHELVLSNTAVAAAAAVDQLWTTTTGGATTVVVTDGQHLTNPDAYLCGGADGMDTEVNGLSDDTCVVHNVLIAANDGGGSVGTGGAADTPTVPKAAKRKIQTKKLKVNTVTDGEKKFQCSWTGCLYGTDNRGNFQKHYRIHTGEKPYKCTHDGCQYSCSDPARFREHKLIHSTEKGYVCGWPGCTWKFKTHKLLKNHIKACHTGDKPHKCEWPGCEKQFLNKYEVRDHMRQHTGDRPFKCEYPDCNGAFARSNTLTQHIREVHYYKRQYFCDYSDCGADSGYDTVDQLKDHIRHRHPKHPTVPSVATV